MPHRVNRRPVANHRAAPLLTLILALLPAPSVLAAPLKVGVYIDNAPLGFVDEHGQTQGFDIDVARALCAAIAADCELVPSEWDDLIPGLVAHRLDFAVTSMSITEARRRKVDFTRPYYESPGWFLARRGRFAEITPDTVKGLRIGVRRGTTHDAYATDTLGSSAEILRYGSQPDALLDLLLGRIDLALGDRLALDRNFLARPVGQGFARVGEPVWDPRWYGDGLGVALPKGEEALRERLDRAVEQIHADGTFARIAQTWLGPNALELTQPPPGRTQP